MTATTKDRNTVFKDAELVAIAVAANAVIPTGVIVCANATGFAVNGSTLTYLGRSEEAVDNTGGADGVWAI